MFLNKKCQEVKEITGFDDEVMLEVRTIYRGIKKFTHGTTVANMMLEEVKKANSQSVWVVLKSWRDALQEAKELREAFEAL